MHLDATTRRILGALIEKRYSTPDQYPLTVNALVHACNQKSNRDPEMHLEDGPVEARLRQLRIEGWITIVERDTGRSVRFAERMVEKLALTDKEAAVLAELLLRGPQTEQELPRRCERMARLAGPEEALAALQAMATRGLVVHLPRESGQRHARWKHLLTPPDEAEAPPATDHVPTYAPSHAAAIPAPHVAPPPRAAGPAFAPPQPMHGLAGVPAASPEAVQATLAPRTPPAPEPMAASAAEVAALRSVIVTLRAEIDRLAERVAKLEIR